jgi:hypothetical protein
MDKKSVVEWMLNQLEGYEYNRIKNKNSWADSMKHLEYIKEKAQQMHKKEIVKAFDEGYDLRDTDGTLLYHDGASTRYYQETYGGQDA